MLSESMWFQHGFRWASAESEISRLGGERREPFQHTPRREASWINEPTGNRVEQGASSFHPLSLT